MLAVTIRFPSGENAASRTESAEPLKLARRWPLSASHRCALLSLPAVTMRLPSGENAASSLFIPLYRTAYRVRRTACQLSFRSAPSPEVKRTSSRGTVRKTALGAPAAAQISGYLSKSSSIMTRKRVRCPTRIRRSYFLRGKPDECSGGAGLSVVRDEADQIFPADARDLP